MKIGSSIGQCLLNLKGADPFKLCSWIMITGTGRDHPPTDVARGRMISTKMCDYKWGDYRGRQIPSKASRKSRAKLSSQPRATLK